MIQSIPARSEEERARFYAELRWFGFPILLVAAGAVLTILDASFPGWSGAGPIVGYGVLGSGVVLTLRALILAPPIVSRINRQ